jgi:hypothetical protein
VPLERSDDPEPLEAEPEIEEPEPGKMRIINARRR